MQIILADDHDVGVLSVEQSTDGLFVGLIEILPAWQRRGIVGETETHYLMRLN